MMAHPELDYDALEYGGGGGGGSGNDSASELAPPSGRAAGDGEEPYEAEVHSVEGSGSWGDELAVAGGSRTSSDEDVMDGSRSGGRVVLYVTGEETDEQVWL